MEGMIQKFLRNRFGKIQLIKVFSMTALSTIIKMLTGFISVKVVSNLLGPSGIATLGQLVNFTSIMLMLASGGINNGVTKYISEYKERSETMLAAFISSALKIVLTCSLVLGVCSILFKSYLAQYLLFSHKYEFVFVLFGVTIFLYAFNGLLLSVLNGHKKFKKFVQVSIADSIFGLSFSMLLIYAFGLKGALVSAVTYQSVVVFITLWILRKEEWLTMRFFFKMSNGIVLKKYFQYSLMAIVTALTFPLSQLVIRGYIINHMSASDAGIWEAMNRLSNMYLLVVTSSFSVYYLPRLSEISDEKLIRKEIFTGFKVILPILFVGFVMVYALRISIIKIIFSDAFLKMEELFIWQLGGDFLKISSWIIAFLMIAKAKSTMFIVTEVIFSVSLILLSFYFIRVYGVIGVTKAYCLNYSIYFITMCILFRKLLFARNKNLV